ncbi:similar to Saccharomyces cerevisiae YNL026W SAM50 Essential component of the Sorting and Assembly Machinery (SAM or TOB complex) of the mitochondrial outer membrane [Maudiozyma barnettii]|uniref:Similar to Saccharomyces cerevisiae YNL026W SAM50 Essential component of the Sorting and Assembly Machinery (SAM or TOB complex) of the mitochondrial outer membrane n=1 Tax=Maudiozyma barnettii TaxID=61262 RepID=A0A8H2VCK2_9SACH|nr:SAM complex subunit SAM50 [Kazachstania barnettii]CAB4252793.1 similar to Saccharomyces cerevisiae YNL026W SAM50 Essential component of the Sorting and Assembly Machinery (SAM or TOB complex) of the mitochondrial outer membrane [Kazachstania barnettii]CAD1780583.1 similar to Saccharomyces cerevisiae YNL026W SAM50 Essential component of the Sorting and Assembly Machinery (SAM or TOB complex) of the mitochondrial outer membrane [Kazachstania barnettii]
MSNSSDDMSTNETGGKVELSQQYITQLLLEDQDIPIKIVNVDTVPTTTKNCINDKTFETFCNGTLYKCEKLSDLQEQSNNLITRLHQSNLISAIIPIFETEKSTVHPHELTIPLPITITLRYQPKSHFTAKTGTNITNSGQGDAYLTFQKRNLLGLDETVTLDHRRDTGTNAGTNVSMLFPYIIRDNAFLTGKIDVFDMKKFLGVKDQGISFTANTCYTRGWNHSLTFESLKRQFHYPDYIESTKNKNKWVSEQLLIQEGEFFKNNLKLTSVLDERNSTIAPSSGYLLKFTNELSSKFQNLQFWKTAMEFNWVKSWFKNDFVTVSNTIKCGFIKNLNQNESYIHFIDKFQNGGPNDVRSFSPMGLGPRELGHSLGGDAFIAYGTSVFSRIPINAVANSGFRLHGFINGGKLMNHNNLPFQDTLRQLGQEHSSSIGIGLVLRHPMARFELSFAVPLTTHEDDLTRKGFQFGLGFEFL